MNFFTTGNEHPDDNYRKNEPTSNEAGDNAAEISSLFYYR